MSKTENNKAQVAQLKSAKRQLKQLRLISPYRKETPRVFPENKFLVSTSQTTPNDNTNLTNHLSNSSNNPQNAPAPIVPPTTSNKRNNAHTCKTVLLNPKTLATKLIFTKQSDSLIAFANAALHGDVQKVKYFLQTHGTLNINSITDTGYTPLMLAVENRHIDVINLLLDFKADVNHSAIDNVTPLIVASQRGFVEVVRLLLAAGANINAQSSQGLTALIFAICKKHDEVAEVLLEVPDINIALETASGFNALQFAIKLNKHKIVQLILAHLQQNNDTSLQSTCLGNHN